MGKTADKFTASYIIASSQQSPIDSLILTALSNCLRRKKEWSRHVLETQVPSGVP